MSNYEPPPWANDYTELRDRPSRYWGITPISKWLGHGILIKAVFPAFTAALLAALPLVILGMLGVNTRAAILLVGLAAGISVYLLWNSVQPEGMKPLEWLYVRYDYAFRQPRRFNGLKVDTEPTSLAWSVIVYTPHPKAQKRTRGATT